MASLMLVEIMMAVFQACVFSLSTNMGIVRSRKRKLSGLKMEK